MPKAERPSNLTHSNLTRRRFLQGIAGAGLALGSMVGYTRLIEPHWLSIDKIELPIINLPPALDGKRIAQLSDIHLCQYFSPNDLAEALQQVEQQAPNWLMLTGDFVGDNAEDAAGLVEPLRALTMPIFGVLGNHDCWTDRSTVSSFLVQANVQLLINNAIQLAPDFWCAGVDDLWAGHPDVSAALSNVPTNATTILLAHEPDFFDVVLHEKAPVALQLSGHSHGGQIRFPTINADPSGHYSFAPVLPRYGRQYPIGLRQVNGQYVYTNRGVGLWPIPYRFNCRPELTIFTLRAT
jgi:predicted MPP superfamily phosphohydrolase